MTSERPTEQPHAREHLEQRTLASPFGASIPLGEAARHLGVSPGAMRMRLSRGTLRGEKRGRQWFVALGEGIPEPHANRTGERTGERTANARTDERGARASFGSVATDALIAELRADVAYLRERLAAADAGQAELRRMLNLEQQTLAAVRSLPAPAVPAVQPDSPENGLGTVVPTSDLSASASALRDAVKAAGVKGKKTRRRLLARLADALRGA